MGAAAELVEEETKHLMKDARSCSLSSDLPMKTILFTFFSPGFHTEPGRAFISCRSQAPTLEGVVYLPEIPVLLLLIVVLRYCGGWPGRHSGWDGPRGRRCPSFDTHLGLSRLSDVPATPPDALDPLPDIIINVSVGSIRASYPFAFEGGAGDGGLVLVAAVLEEADVEIENAVEVERVQVEQLRQWHARLHRG